MRKDEKIVYILIFILLLIAGSYGKCFSYRFSFYPTNRELQPDSKIIIEGIISSKNVIDSLNSKYPIYLISKNDTVQLEVLSKNIGSYSIAQAILKPNRELVVGKVYTVKIDNLSDANMRAVKDRDRVTGNLNDVTFTVSDRYEADNLDIILEPKFERSSYNRYGCGPSLFAFVSFTPPLTVGTIVNCELIDNSAKTEVNYYIEVDRSLMIRLGHGMCSGPFDFIKGHAYSARFYIVDMVGENNGRWSKTIKIENPLK
jgi:hypothetical protein